MSRLHSVSRKARRILLPYRKQGAVYTAIYCIIYMLLLTAGAAVQELISEHGVQNQGIAITDLVLIVLLIASIIITVPLQNSMDRWIGTVTGVLTECDSGFLDCTSTAWLWFKRVRLFLFSYAMLLLSILPSCILLGCTILSLRYAGTNPDGTLALLAAMHMAIGSVLLLILPLRCSCTMAALPLCFLKQPHHSVYAIWRYAMQCTKGLSGILLLQRFKALLLSLIPFYGFVAVPQLFASEMLLCYEICRERYPEWQ